MSKAVAFYIVLKTFVESLDGVEKAINLLADTQKACEEIYIDTDETEEN